MSAIDTTPTLSLPYILDGQAMKHITHNEALLRLDSLVQMTVTGTVAALPANGDEGTQYLLSEDTDGGLKDQIAIRRATGWDMLTPLPGWRLWDAGAGELRVFHDAAWQSVNSGSSSNTGGGGTNTPPETLNILGINATADTTNRLSVIAPATLLNHEGAGHQLKINKAAPTDTASLLFQTAFGGRAEMGLAGDDNFSIKVSPDGSTFHTAVQITSEGVVDFPQNPDTSSTQSDSNDEDLWVAAIDAAGGQTERMGPMSVHTIPLGRETLNLNPNRVIMSSFFVDQPRTLLGVNVAQHSASSSAGSVLRAGLFAIGEPDENDWIPGALIADYGTHPADIAGHKRFDLATPLTLQRGWYLHAIGTDGSGASVRAAQWTTPGLANYMSHNSGISADYRVTGVSRYIYKNNVASLITGGFPAAWTDGFTDAVFLSGYTTVPVLPIWQLD